MMEVLDVVSEARGAGGAREAREARSDASTAKEGELVKWMLLLSVGDDGCESESVVYGK